MRQGTVNPTLYHVIWDGLELPAERMQTLTFKMTHLYYNWPGTVRPRLIFCVFGSSDVEEPLLFDTIVGEELSGAATDVRLIP